MQVQDKPDWTPYTVGVCWKDGMVREASFSIDEIKIAELEAADPANVSREKLLLEMLAKCVEQVFASRAAFKASEKAEKLILPERFLR